MGGEGRNGPALVAVEFCAARSAFITAFFYCFGGVSFVVYGTRGKISPSKRPVRANVCERVYTCVGGVRSGDVAIACKAKGARRCSNAQMGLSWPSAWPGLGGERGSESRGQQVALESRGRAQHDDGAAQARTQGRGGVLTSGAEQTSKQPG